MSNSYVFHVLQLMAVLIQELQLETTGVGRCNSYLYGIFLRLRWAIVILIFIEFF